jgi:hypothetical protein
MNLLSSFGGGLWIIPVGLFLAAAYSAYRGYLSSKSNSVQQLPGGGYKENTGNVPFYKTGGGVFCIGFTLALIGVIIWMIRDR